MPELLLMSSLNPVTEGQDITQSRHPWVTLQQYFTIPDSRMDAFEQRVGQAAEAFFPIAIQGAERDLFGPDNDVGVRRVAALGKGATLHALHTVLGEVILHHDGEMRNPEWAFEGYNPHITYTDDRALERGEITTLNTVELVGKDAQNHKIIQKIWELSNPPG